MASVIDLGNNKYRLIVSNGYDVKGKRKRASKTIQVNSMREAERQATILEAEVLTGKVEHSNNFSFKELVENYRAFEENQLAEKTVVRYDGIIDDFLLPAFGKKHVKDIQRYILNSTLLNYTKTVFERMVKRGDTPTRRFGIIICCCPLC